MTIWADTYNGSPIIPGRGLELCPNRLASKFCFHVFQTYLSILNRPRYRFQILNLEIAFSTKYSWDTDPSYRYIKINPQDIGQYKSQPIINIFLNCVINDERFRISFRPSGKSVTVAITDLYHYHSHQYSPADKIRKTAVLHLNKTFLRAIENLFVE